MKSTGNEEHKYISVSEALKMAELYGIKISRMTAITWIKKFDMGHQPGGMGRFAWVVDKNKWEEFILNKDFGQKF